AEAALVDPVDRGAHAAHDPRHVVHGLVLLENPADVAGGVAEALRDPRHLGDEKRSDPLSPQSRPETEGHDPEFANPRKGPEELEDPEREEPASHLLQRD